MAKLSVTTKSVKEVWRSGDRAIFELALDYQGNLFKAKTYSNAIAKEGWSGEVETYEKQGRYGVETFVKQPQREGGYQGYQSRGKAPADPFSMYMSYAKDLAVAFVTLEGEVDATKFKKALKATVEGAKTLYEARPEAAQTAEPPKAVTANESVEDVAKELSEALGNDIEVVDVGEDEPWQADESPQLPV